LETVAVWSLPFDQVFNVRWLGHNVHPQSIWPDVAILFGLLGAEDCNRTDRVRFSILEERGHIN